ncbi:hypothetical protein [Phragmitibacter flavus]|uniref:hypothetical protein n=1 Tax=Phragmitibacter flavus TaxID=2576071 RepID=UPI0010FEA48D|nr:hypothetical protein [Phragmitibacter flavus]
MSHVNAQQPSPPPTDILNLKNGARVSCRVLDITDATISIEYRAPTGAGLLKRDVPWTEVSHVDFAMDSEFQSLLKSTKPVVDTPKFATQWQKFFPLIKHPNHPVGDLGLLYIQALLQNPDPAAQGQALPIIDTIITSDWNPARRQQAKILHLQALAIRNRPEETRAAAKAFLATPDLDPAQAASTHLILAKLAHKELTQLETDNPRWQDDDLIRPTRNDLFHTLIDHCLTPSLFYGTLESPASEGIALAMQFFIDHQDLPSAAALARDLLQLYPNASQTPQATAFLTKHQLPLTPPTDVEEEIAPAPVEDTPDDSTEPEITRRKRYERPPPTKP